MRNDEWDNDEDWYDDNSEPDEDPARCPECGGLIHRISDRCSACGYWLSDADRRAMWSGMGKPAWLRVTVIIVLIAFLLSLMAAGLAILGTS